MSGVELRSVSKKYGKNYAVNNISLEVKTGEFLSLVGPSGCGKTTTLRLVAGFIPPDGGEILLDGQQMKGVRVGQRQVGIVFQNYALFPNLTVFENVAFGLRTRKVPTPEIRHKVMNMLDMVGLHKKAESYPKELSGGQQQRVALARALAITPKVLLLDEPLSALDAKVRNVLRFEIKRIQRESGITAIYVTHDQEEALSISDRVALMSEGRLEQVDTPNNIYLRPANTFVANFVGENNLLAGEYLGDGCFLWQGRKLAVENVPLPPGPCSLMIRPERILLDPGEKCIPRENQLQGVVTGRVFLGPLMRLAVKAKEGETFLLDILNSHTVPPGVNETISFGFVPSEAFAVQKSNL